MRKLLTLQRTLTRKQRVILLLAVAAIVLVLLFAAVFGDRISFALRQAARHSCGRQPPSAGVMPVKWNQSAPAKIPPQL